MGNMTQSELFKNLITKNTDYFEAAKFRLTFFFFLLFAKYAELQKLNNNNLVLVLVHVR